MSGMNSQVPVPNVKSSVAKLMGTVQTLQAGDVWKDWFEGYASRHGWKLAGINPILMMPWRGAPFRVKGQQVWPGAAISRYDEQYALHLGQAAQWTVAMTGSGHAMHPTWVGSTLVFAALGDSTLRDRAPFSLVRADKLPVGSRILALTSLSKMGLNRGIPLGSTSETKIRYREGVGVPGFHVYAAEQSTIGESVVEVLPAALAQWRAHVRFQDGILLTWGWQGKRMDGWESEADAALAVLVAVRAALIETDGASPVPPVLTDRPAAAIATRPASEAALTPITLRYVGRTRRDPSTGTIEVTKPPKLKLPRGTAGTIARWLVTPGALVPKGQSVAVLKRNDGQEVDLLCPRAGHRVVRRCGVGAKVHDQSVIVSLERIS